MITGKKAWLAFGFVFILTDLLGFAPNLLVALNGVAGAQSTEAEAYHRDYYKKNPLRYKFYRSTCGRDQRLKELWGSSR